jgi:hypothetical protein
MNITAAAAAMTTMTAAAKITMCYDKSVACSKASSSDSMVCFLVKLHVSSHFLKDMW